MEKWLFFLLVIGQSWVGANAASEEAQGRSKPTTRMWQEMEVKESSWKDAFSKEFDPKEGQDRTGMQKRAKKDRSTFLNGSAWSTERNYMRRHKGTFDILFGVEHRMKKEEMEEQFNDEDKKGLRLQLTQQESQMENQAVRTANTRRMESL